VTLESVVSNESDTKCLRTLTLMSAGLFGLFVGLVVLANTFVK
jgi:hypothetical protein